MKLDFDYLSKTYFYFDKPVEFELKNKNKVNVYPVLVKDSEIFLSSYNILTIDKNALPNVEIIQMSYLQFICDVLITDNSFLHKFINILNLCLGIKFPLLVRDEKHRPIITNEDKTIIITHNDFEQIKSIILHQNLNHYRDEYIDPEFKKMMNEMDEVKYKGYDFPSIERKMAMITAHTGISKKEQLEMTFRSHSLLFEEIIKEIKFIGQYPIALYTGNVDKIDSWVYEKKSNPYSEYLVDINKYAEPLGGAKNIIQSSNGALGDSYIKQFNSFNK